MSHSVVNDISTPPPELACIIWDVNEPTATDPPQHSSDENYASHLDLEAVDQNPTFSEVPNLDEGKEDPPPLLFAECNEFCLQFPNVRFWTEGLNILTSCSVID